MCLPSIIVLSVMLFALTNSNDEIPFYLPLLSPSLMIKEYHSLNGQALRLDPNGLIDNAFEIIWSDSTPESSGGGGMLRSLPDPTVCPEGYPPHRNVFGIDDIAGLEGEIRTNRGRDGLLAFVEGRLYVLHRMGLGRSFGIRDMHIFGQEEIIHISNQDDEWVPSEESYFGLRVEDKIREVVGGLLSETPDAALTLHRFGTRLNLDLIEGFIPVPEGYKRISDQTGSDLSDVPEARRGNVRILMEQEEMSLKDNTSYYKNLFGYSRERDKTTYRVAANGTFMGFNNRRAMPGYIRRIRKQDPRTAILVHRSGSQLDFELVDRLAVEEVTSHFIKRECERTDVTYHVRGCDIRNITSQGIELFTNSEYKVGADITLSLYTPGSSEPTLVPGQVRWVRDDTHEYNYGTSPKQVCSLEECFGKGARGYKYALGIQFKNPITLEDPLPLKL